MLNNNLKEKNDNNFFNGILHFASLDPKEHLKILIESIDNFKNFNKFMLSDSLNIPPGSDIFKTSLQTCSEYCKYLALKAKIFLFDTEEGMRHGENG